MGFNCTINGEAFIIEVEEAFNKKAIFEGEDTKT